VAGLPIDTHDFSSSAAALLGALGTTTVVMWATIERLRERPRPAP
jgi:hypothetical protein